MASREVQEVNDVVCRKIAAMAGIQLHMGSEHLTTHGHANLGGGQPPSA
jgi:hypothetical protein